MPLPPPPGWRLVHLARASKRLDLLRGVHADPRGLLIKLVRVLLVGVRSHTAPLYMDLKVAPQMWRRVGEFLPLAARLQPERRRLTERQYRRAWPVGMGMVVDLVDTVAWDDDVKVL